LIIFQIDIYINLEVITLNYFE